MDCREPFPLELQAVSSPEEELQQIEGVRELSVELGVISQPYIVKVTRWVPCSLW